MVPDFSLENEYTLGIIIGLLSAILYALRNIFLKKVATGQSGVVLMLYQLLVIILFLWPVWIFHSEGLTLDLLLADWQALLFLSVFTTALAHTLLVVCIKFFNVNTMSILTTTGPLFGSIFGYWLLSEVPSGRTLIGGAIISVVVVLESIRHFAKK